MAAIHETKDAHDIRSEAERQDRIVKNQLLNKLRCQFGFSAAEIDVCCTNGIVVLEGHVDCFYQKQMAQELARRTADVQSVVNRIVVDPSRSRERTGETFRADSEYCLH